MFGFCESSARNPSSTDFAILVVRRVMGVVLAVCLLGLIVLVFNYTYPLVSVVFSTLLIIAGIWIVHHEEDYATRLVEWCRRLFA